MQRPRTQNVRSVGVRDKCLNQKVERLNGVFRDREKVMRGMDHAESSQRLSDAYRIYYNFVREHMGIKKTPAEEAGVKIQGDNKWITLIQNASNS